MVLGAVATGNIKPSEAARVAGIIKLKAGSFKEIDKASNTGKASCILATLDANSLIKVIMIHIPKIINKICLPLKT